MTRPTLAEAVEQMDVLAVACELAVNVPAARSIPIIDHEKAAFVGDALRTILAACRRLIEPGETDVERVAKVLLIRCEGPLPEEMATRVMATTEHLGPRGPPCRMAATCDACVRDEYLDHARAAIAALQEAP